MSMDGDPSSPGSPHHRRRSRRSRTVSGKPSKSELREFSDLRRDYQTSAALMRHPKKRVDCEFGQRPCPWVSCRHHLYLEVDEKTGSIKLNFPSVEIMDMHETCSLDVAEHGGVTLEQAGVIMNLTRERIRQLEVGGLVKLRLIRIGEESLPVVSDET